MKGIQHLLEEVKQNIVVFLIVRRSIICGRLRQVIYLRDTDQSRNFANTEFSNRLQVAYQYAQEVTAGIN